MGVCNSKIVYKDKIGKTYVYINYIMIRHNYYKFCCTKQPFQLLHLGLALASLD